MSAVIFTESQQAAIDVSRRGQDACVVAGPGSGKTTVLVEYFRQLVNAEVEPGRILAITFTEKAAGNMRAKLGEAFQADPETRAKLERGWVSTVHGFCARLLKENAVLAGVDPQFTVADDLESRRLQVLAIDEAVVGLFDEHPAAVRDLIRGLSAFDFEGAVLSAYDAMRGAGMSIEAVAAIPEPPGTTRHEVAEAVDALRHDPLDRWKPEQRIYRKIIVEQADRILAAQGPKETLLAIGCFSVSLNKCRRDTTAYELVRHLRDDLLEEFQYSLISELYRRERETLVEILRRFDRVYRERKRQSGALDFADLEECAVRLLEESPETRARLQGQFDHIVMDEFQDTNGQQARLLQLMRRPGRFYAVGDINQSIFGFRHAEPDVFREYRDQVERLVELGDNFRSRAQILSAVETIAAGAAGIESRALVAKRAFDGPREVCVDAVVAVANQIDAALEIEARSVARRILELASEGDRPFAFREMAVLVRNTEVLAEFAAAFDEAGIPYSVNRGRGFYEAREVNDLAHLLRVIANPRDEISLAAVLRAPLVQVSDEALLRLKALDANLGAALSRLGHAAGDFDPDDFAKLSWFRDRLHGWRLRREAVSFDRLLLEAIDDCGYPAEPGTRAWANIEKFLVQTRRAAARLSLDEYVEELAAIRDSDPREPDAPPEDSTNAVNVMTVHAAKGLEFPVVFVSALHKGVQTNPPVIAFSRRLGLGAHWRHPATGEEVDDRIQHAIRGELKQREEEESSRLLYVAMTRAEQHLVLSFSVSGKKRDNWVKLIVPKLGLDLERTREEIQTHTAPDRKEWRLQLRVVDRAPAPMARPVLEDVAPMAERLAPPEIADQQDTNATVTAVAAYAKCPREYYLGHYLGCEGRARGPADAGDLTAAELGTQVHALLAGTAVPEPDAEAVRLADVFRQSPLGRRASQSPRIEREFDFLMAVDDLVLRGQVDLWFEESGELTIVDYKTDSVTAQEAHQRAQDYAMQLRLYALAVERVTGRAPSHAWLHFLRPNTAIEVDLTPSLLDAPERVIREFQEAQARLEFPLLEAAHCRRCQFFQGLCPSAYHGA